MALVALPKQASVCFMTTTTVLNLSMRHLLLMPIAHLPI